MSIPKDKYWHFLAGLAIAWLALVAWSLAAQMGLVEMGGAWLGCLIASSVAGAVKEKADYDDNKIQPGMHGVEWEDALATALGGVPIAVLLVLWG